MKGGILDVLVVGAGMVGAALALDLLSRDGGRAGAFGERRPLRVGVVEPSPPPPEPVDPGLRTVALTPTHLEALRTFLPEPARARLDAHACPYVAMEVWDAEGGGRLRFEASEVGADTLGAIVPNAVLQQGLWQAVTRTEVLRLPGMAVAALAPGGEGGDAAPWRIRLDASGAAGTDVPGGRSVRAHLLVGADGARSRVAELVGAGARSVPYGQRAVVFNARFREPHGGVARQAFLRTGPVGLLPLHGDGRDCSVVWSLDDAAAEEVGALPDAQLGLALERATDRCLGPVEAVSARGAFPLLGRHAHRYAGSGWILVGDAAHVVHPLAGQGVNLGLRDAAALAAAITRLAARRGARPEHLATEAWLARLERERRAENDAMLEGLGLLKRLFALEDPWLHLVRNLGLRGVDRTAVVRRLFASEALGVV